MGLKALEPLTRALPSLRHGISGQVYLSNGATFSLYDPPDSRVRVVLFHDEKYDPPAMAEEFCKAVLPDKPTPEDVERALRRKLCVLVSVPGRGVVRGTARTTGSGDAVEITLDGKRLVRAGIGTHAFSSLRDRVARRLSSFVLSMRDNLSVGGACVQFADIYDGSNNLEEFAVRSYDELVAFDVLDTFYEEGEKQGYRRVAGTDSLIIFPDGVEIRMSVL